MLSVAENQSFLDARTTQLCTGLSTTLRVYSAAFTTTRILAWYTVWSSLIMFDHDQHLPARCKMSIANAKIIILQSLHRTTFGQVSNRKARSSQTLKSQLEDLFEDTRVGIGCRVYRRIFWRWYLQNMCIIIAIIHIHIHIYIYIHKDIMFLSRDISSSNRLNISKRRTYPRCHQTHQLCIFSSHLGNKASGSSRSRSFQKASEFPKEIFIGCRMS